MSDYDPTDQGGLEAAQAKKATRDKLIQETEAADIKWLMGTKRGRRILWRQLDKAGVFRLSFSTNALAMAFAEGNRNEGLRTLTLIHTLCSELYGVMVKEATDDNRNDDGSRKNH